MHVPVLLKEVMTYFDPQRGEEVIDATVNGGGHAEAMLEATAPDGILLGIDRDPAMLEHSRVRLRRFGDRVILAEGNFSHIATIAEKAGVLHPSVILFDLGFSSYHLASGRGFSFAAPADPLDMRYSKNADSLTASAIVNHAPFEELVRIFRDFGEYRNAEALAERIVRERKQRKFHTVGDLLLLFEDMPRGKTHPATKIMQALRIAVNEELAHVERGIREAWRILRTDGKLGIISFHSLEDRIAKTVFRAAKLAGGELITKKPITAGRDEVRQNPRARSAKFRVIKKI